MIPGTLYKVIGEGCMVWESSGKGYFVLPYNSVVMYLRPLTVEEKDRTKFNVNLRLSFVLFQDIMKIMELNYCIESKTVVALDENNAL